MKYNGSLIHALQKVYPEESWREWNFYRVTNKYWKSIRNQRYFFSRIASFLNISNWKDWYSVNLYSIRASSEIEQREIDKLVRGVFKYEYSNDMYKALSSVFPEYPWNPKLFIAVKEKETSSVANRNLYQYCASASQDHLKHAISVLFSPSLFQLTKGNPLSIYLNYAHPKISPLFPNMKLDLFIPELNLAFEYQGTQHFDNTDGANGIFYSQMENRERDKVKLQVCSNIGISLIFVSHLWDRSISSLFYIILSAKPELSAYFHPFVSNSYLNQLSMLNATTNKKFISPSKKTDSTLLSSSSLLQVVPITPLPLALVQFMSK